MDFVSKKIENCFSDAENYEYRIEAKGSELIKLFDSEAEWLHINDELRRPTFSARMKNGTQLKGLLEKQIIKVGFVSEDATRQKKDFEQWLHKLMP